MCSSGEYFSAYFQKKEECLLENSKLQKKLKMLQDLFQLCEFQLKDLLGNNYHRRKSKVFSARKMVPLDIFLPITSGSLLVYDQGTLFRGYICLS